MLWLFSVETHSNPLGWLFVRMAVCYELTARWDTGFTLGFLAPSALGISQRFGVSRFGSPL